MASKVKFDVPDYTLLLNNAVADTRLEVGFRIEEVAKENAPVNSGYYRNQIEFDGKDKVTAHADYSAPIEYGINNPVIIRPKTARALRFTVNGEEVFAKSVQQKTRPPNPVMRNAARTVQKEVGGLFFRNFEEGRNTSKRKT